METRLVLIMQRLAGKSGMVVRAACVLAKFGYWLYLLYGICEWFHPGTRREIIGRRRMLWQCLFSVMTGSFVSFIIGKLAYRKRPFAAHPAVRALLPHKENASFPSNHAMNGMAVALQLLFHGRRMGWFFLPWAILIGVSRVICGIHYASDVLGGFALGAASAAIIRTSAAARRTASELVWLYDGLCRAGRILSRQMRY